MQDLKVEPIITTTNFDGFVITTPDGTKYTFGKYGSQLAIDKTDDPIGTPQSYLSQFANAWHLVRVESADGNYNIDLTYQPVSFRYKYLASATHSTGTDLCLTPDEFRYHTPNNAPEWYTTLRSQRLIKIETSTSTVDFLSTTIREDLDIAVAEPGEDGNPRALDQIDITSGTNSDFCKSFFLSYDYFENSTVTESHDKRLLLESIQEKSCDNSVVIPPHIFEYDAPANGNGSLFLPSRLSKRIDHWGYFNDATGNDGTTIQYLIPPTKIFVDNVFKASYGVADRESSTAATTGVIKKHTYPTGGYTEYSFGVNEAEGVGYGPEMPLRNETTCASDCCNTTTLNNTITFTATELATAEYIVTIKDLEQAPYNLQDPCNTDRNPLIINATLSWYNNASDFLVGQRTFNVSIPSGGSTPPNYGTIEGTILNLGDNVGIVAGTEYRYELEVEDGIGDFDMFYFNTFPENKMVGGLRLEEVVSYDPLTMKEVRRTYNYEAENSTISSGVLYQKEPTYGYYIHEPGLSYERYFFTSTSVVPLGDVNGYHIGYERVEEVQTGNGKTVYEYQIEEINSSPDYPFVPDPPQYDNHIIDKKKVFEEGQSNPQAVDDIDGEVIEVVVPYVAYAVPSIPCYTVFVNNNLLNLIINSYDGTAREGLYRVTKETKELDGVTSVVDYAYPSSIYDHTNPISVTMTNSDGKVTVSKTKYAFEAEASSTAPFNDPIYDDMLTKNMVAIPIEQTTEVDGTQIAGTRTLYKDFNGHPYPEIFQNYEYTWDFQGSPLIEGWKTEGTINAYNSIGKPTQFTQRGWDPESYTWDATNYLITSRTFKNFVWNYDYIDGTLLVEDITDIDGQVVNYAYDELMRLESASARGGNVSTNYEYNYSTSPTTYNYVKTSIDFGPSASQSSLDIRNTFQYLDGLGRPIQTIEQAYTSGVSPKDVVTIVEYDQFGRVEKTYEPIENTVNTGAYYVGAVPSFFTENEYYDSPLNRIKSVTPPDWNYPTLSFYGNNANSINVPGGDSYAAGELYETKVTDPNGHSVLTYTDKKGRQIRVTREGDGSSVYTDYDYDTKDRVRTVIPPGGDLYNTLHYEYTYDGRDRIMTKKIPDQDIMNYLYDERNLQTYLQDGNMSAEGKWLHSHYDDYGRVTGTGWAKGDQTDGDQVSVFEQALVRNYYDGFGLSNPAAIYTGKLNKTETLILGTTSDWLQSSMTYDTHGRIIETKGNHHLNLLNIESEISTFDYDFADNVLVDDRTHVPATGPNQTIRKEMHYDHSGRLIENYFQVNGGANVQICELDYTHKDELMTKRIGVSGASQLQKVDFTYLQNGFLSTINAPTGGTSSALALCPPGLPNPGAPSGDNDLFHLELKYDNPVNFGSGDAAPQYNGNIAQIIWQSRGREKQTYGFKYDYLDRLTHANYAEYPSAGGFSENDRFTTSYTYDPRGNILSLTREGMYWDGNCWQEGEIDDLAYTYVGLGAPISNQLESIHDSAPAASKDEGFIDNTGSGAKYQYDENGNMIFDPNKGMDIVYNYLNLPNIVEAEDCKILEFTYDASGAKLSKKVRDGNKIVSQHDYIGGIEYQNGEIEAMYHDEGRVYFEEGIARYEYSITDHLGNTRVVFSDKNNDGDIDVTDNQETNEVINESHYYPFGMQMKGSWMKGSWMKEVGEAYRYLYNGKELNEEFGLNWLDYGARFYDPVIGRFTTQDRFSEKYFSYSTYGYAANNPISNIDINGDSIKVNHKGKDLLYVDGTLYDGDKEYRGKGVKVNKDGSIKYKGFLKRTVNALDDIASTESGGGLIAALQASDKNIVIKFRRNAANFVPGFEKFSSPDLRNNAEGSRVLSTGQKVLEFFEFSEIGSGGTVYWDPSARPDGEISSLVLGHELFHALDASNGTLDSRYIKINGGSVQIQEMRAVYNTNLIRREMGRKFRSSYSGGPSLLDSRGRPVNVIPRGVIPSHGSQVPHLLFHN